MGHSCQDTLEYLETANLFIVSLDSERKWFSYHHLFSELLRQRLNRRHPDLETTLHLRASNWYAKEDLIDQAVSHILMAVGISNREIAEELVLAVSTIKTHLNHIYRKLDVNNRTQAVAKSQKLDLL